MPTVKKEVNSLVELGFIRRCETDLEWDSSCFIVTNKNGTEIFIANFRDFNKVPGKSHLKPEATPYIEDH